MPDDSTEPRYLMGWDHSRSQRLDRDVVSTGHRLAELPLFSDEELACLIDRYSADAMQVTTMGENPAHRSQLQYGQLGDYSGREWIEMIRRGRLCLQLNNVIKHDERLGDIVHRLSAEMMECQPGLRTDSHDGELRIGSPYILDYLGLDVEPTVFWQIRGERKVLAYPCGEPIVPPRVLQETVTGRSEQPLYFEPAFDDDVTTHGLVPGDVVGLPQHTPYRIVGGGTISISLTTRYRTRASRRRNDIQRANHFLGRWNRASGYSITTTGPASFAKSLLARAIPGRSHKSTELPKEISFCVSPYARNCVGEVEDCTDQPVATPRATKTVPMPTTASLNTASLNTATTPSEFPIQS